jgi:hypothetical protein
MMLGINSTVNARGNSGNKKYYFIATDGETNAGINHHHYVDTWTGEGLEQRIITLEWYAIYRGGIASLASQGWKVNGVKANFKVYSIENDMFLEMCIYKGGFSSPKMSETILWQVVNGKDSTNDRATSVFMSIETGEVSEAIYLYSGEEATIGLPFSYSYSCRMWLM